MPVAAIIEGKIFCVHGGLSPLISTVDQIRLINRKQEIPHEGAYCDLMWSDPDDIEAWIMSYRSMDNVSQRCWICIRVESC